MKLTKITIITVLVFSLAISANSCKPETETPDQTPKYAKINIDPSMTYQKMIGFGGALSWYSDRIEVSSKKNEIYQLMFQDLGLDILRLKNWYYPMNYPINKLPENMVSSGDRTLFLATNIFYAKAKELDPTIKVLFSSWGPPIALKSNNNLNEGILKKEGDAFMYDAFAQYWSDILDNITFSPDYLSIQNEPGYTNAGWTTCRWGATESTNVAGYDVAFDKVYDKIKNRSKVPVMIGPETENIDSHTAFTNAIKNKASCPILAYHTYNFNKNEFDLAAISAKLSGLKTLHGDKPSMMTEYSGMPWFNTARFIQLNLTQANSSGYIYWLLVWGDVNTKDEAMIYITSSGNYELSPFYYVLKHFSKFINKDYVRINTTSSIPSVEVSGFINPDGTQMTILAINTDTRAFDYQLNILQKQASSMKIYQTVEGDYFKDLGAFNADSPINLAGNSITTIVVDLE